MLSMATKVALLDLAPDVGAELTVHGGPHLVLVLNAKPILFIAVTGMIVDIAGPDCAQNSRAPERNWEIISVVEPSWLFGKSESRVCCRSRT
jgi:hypothetical protein